MLTRTADQQEQRAGSASSPDPIDVLTSLFPRVAAATILLLLVLLSIRGASGSKVWDRAAFVCAVGAAVLLSVRFLRGDNVRPSRVAAVVGVVGMLGGVAFVEHHQLAPGFVPWEGFGTSVALVCVPLAVLFLPFATWIRRSRRRSATLATLMLGLALIDLVSLVRDLGDFSIPSNNIFVLNEALAPSAGRVPGANFVPQYTNLLGWVFVPVRHLMSAHALANTVTIAVSGLGIAAVVLAVVLARRALPERSLWIALGLTVPLATVTALHNTLDSSIGSYFQELPIRMFPALLYSVLAVTSLTTLMRQSVRKVSLVLLGVLAALMVWNNQDFGIAVALAYGIVLQIAIRGPLRTRATLLWSGGLVMGAVLYPIWAKAIGHPLQLTFFGLTARSYQAGFESELIHIPGPVLLVLPLILASVAVGATLVRKTCDGSATLTDVQQVAALTLAFVGMWSTFGFVYYLNLSSASAQLQLFLLPFGVCCCALLSLCQSTASSRESPGRSNLDPSLKGKVTWWLLPVMVPIAVGFGAILQTPSLSISVDALTHPARSNGFLATVPTGVVVRGVAYARAHGGGSVGYFGPNANYVALSTGVTSRVLYDDPGDFSLSATAKRLGCNYLRHDPTRWLVVASTVGALSVVAHAGPGICGTYQQRTVPGEPPDTVFELRRNTGTSAG
jgi:hypothetical protein